MRVKPLTVEVYSGAESVRLSLNGKLSARSPPDAIRISKPSSTSPTRRELSRLRDCVGEGCRREAFWKQLGMPFG